MHALVCAQNTRLLFEIVIRVSEEKNFNLNKALFKANEAKTKVAIKILYDINFNVEQIGNYC